MRSEFFQNICFVIIQNSNVIFIFQMYLTIHSYGQYFLYPWGYEKLDTHDRHELHNMGRIGAQAIQRVNPRRKYKVGSAAKMLYPASGNSTEFDLVLEYISLRF